MKLHWSPRSPFVRKVMIVLHETGQLDHVDRVRSVVAMSQANAALLPDNPLNKIPTLVLDDGTALFDSRVICEYLDGLHEGPKLFPADPRERFRSLRWQAMGDGLMDLLLVWRNWALDRGRPPQDPSDPFLAAFDLKARATLDALEREAGDLEVAPFGIGSIALICAMGLLDFRWAELDWRRGRPGLEGWHARMGMRPSVHMTRVVDDTAS